LTILLDLGFDLFDVSYIIALYAAG
jgi:hypothetical protein